VLSFGGDMQLFNVAAFHMKRCLIFVFIFAVKWMVAVSCKI